MISKRRPVIGKRRDFKTDTQGTKDGTCGEEKIILLQEADDVSCCTARRVLIGCLGSIGEELDGRVSFDLKSRSEASLASTINSCQGGLNLAKKIQDEATAFRDQQQDRLHSDIRKAEQQASLKETKNTPKEKRHRLNIRTCSTLVVAIKTRQ